MRFITQTILRFVSAALFLGFLNLAIAAEGGADIPVPAKPLVPSHFYPQYKDSYPDSWLTFQGTASSSHLCTEWSDIVSLMILYEVKGNPYMPAHPSQPAPTNPEPVEAPVTNTPVSPNPEPVEAPVTNTPVSPNPEPVEAPVTNTPVSPNPEPVEAPVTNTPVSPNPEPVEAPVTNTPVLTSPQSAWADFVDIIFDLMGVTNPNETQFLKNFLRTLFFLS